MPRNIDSQPSLAMLLHVVHSFHVLFFLVTLAAAALRREINITKDLFFPDFARRNPQDITLLGNAAISTENRCIQIPGKELEFSAGRAIYASPVRFLDPATGAPASFSTSFSFRITGRGRPATGGLSFVIVPDELTVGRPGPWLAMMNDACDDDYKVFAVEIDTRMNPEFGDRNDNHIGINLGSVVSSAAINASDLGIDLDDGEVHRAWINYDGGAKFIEIYLGPDSAARPPRPGYAGKLNLSPYLNEYMFVGFSASTGENYTSTHSICSWNFTAASRALLRLPSSETCQSKLSLENPKNSDHTNREAPISFYIVLALLLLALVIFALVYFAGKYKKNQNADDCSQPFPPIRPRNFTASEISAATGGFAEAQILGSDSNCISYKGVLSKDCHVVVKRFSGRRKTMINEIKQVGKIRHPNLVAIRGWCFEADETAVIYDFVPNGGVDRWLTIENLPWNRRLRIIKDVADALRYLHSRGQAHNNVKSSSVFLDMSFRSLLGDFGFGLIEARSPKLESSIRQKVDVFEFGVLVLEIVSGLDRSAGSEFLEIAWRLHERREKEKFVDRRMGSTLIVDQAVRVVEIGLLCTLNENKGRPAMEEVAELLNDDRPLPELPAGRPVCLFPYSSDTGLVCKGYACGPFK